MEVKQYKLGELGEELPKMTKEQVMIAGVSHIVCLAKKSVSPEEPLNCFYDGDGVCCPAAIFIKNYDEKMEDRQWDSLVLKYDQCSKELETILTLQDLHDNKIDFSLSSIQRLESVKYCIPESVYKYILERLN